MNPDTEKLITVLKQIKKTIHIENNFVDILNELQSKKSLLLKNSAASHNYYCPIIYNELEILADGNVYPCCISLGNIPGISIKKYTIVEIWNMYHNFRKNIIKKNFYPFCKTSCTLLQKE